MTGNPIPDDVRRFIVNGIASIPHLEAILLFRSQPVFHWEIAQLARRLYIPEKKTAELIRDLVSGGIVTQASQAPDRFQYHPETPELLATLDQLASVYSSHLVEVTNLIHSRTHRKAQQFADAFKWKEEK